MKIVIEKHSWGGITFCEGRNSLRNTLSRLETTRNLYKKFDLTQKLEQFSEREKVPLKKVLPYGECGHEAPPSRDVGYGKPIPYAWEYQSL